MQAKFYKKYLFSCTSRQNAKKSPAMGRESQRLPLVSQITPSKTTESSRAVAAPSQRRHCSANRGPASHAAAIYAILPPSSRRRGSRLKAHNTILHPIHRSHSCRSPNANRDAHRKFAAGPAATAKNSSPYDRPVVSASKTAPNALIRIPLISARYQFKTR